MSELKVGIWLVGGSVAVLGGAAVLLMSVPVSEGQSPRGSRVFSASAQKAPVAGAVSSPLPLVTSVMQETLQSVVRGELGPLDDPRIDERVAGALELRGWGDAAARGRAARLLVEEMKGSAGGGRVATGPLNEIQRRAISVVATRLAKRLVDNEGGGESTAASTEDLAVELPEGYRRLDWKPLGQFTYRPGEGVPEGVQRLGQKQVGLVGYMLPVEQTRGARKFLLVESLWGCCFGSVPEMNQVIDVHVAATEGVDFRAEPVLVTGVLEVGEQLEDGVVVSLYRLQGATVVPLD